MEWVVIISAYLLGSIPSAYLAGKLKNNIDIREQGSGNVGTMNARQVLGWIPAVLVLCMDLGKGAAAVYLARWLGEDLMLAALFAVVGHIYPLWLRFKGGKGLAPGAGALAAAGFPWALLAFLVVFAVAYRVLKQSDPAICIGIWAAGIYVLSTGISYFFMVMLVVMTIKIASAINKSSPRVEI